jgi:hypothetical protein
MEEGRKDGKREEKRGSSMDKKEFGLKYRGRVRLRVQRRDPLCFRQLGDGLLDALMLGGESPAVPELWTNQLDTLPVNACEGEEVARKEHPRQSESSSSP